MTSLVVVLFLALVFCSSGAVQKEPCSENQATKDAGNVCVQDKFIACVKQEHTQNPVINSCVQGCGNLLGQNATGIIDCLDEFKGEKLLQKVKQMECVMSESAQAASNFQQQVFFPKQINITEAVKHKMDKNYISSFVPLKAYEKCLKDCIKRGTPKKIKGAPKIQKPEKDAFFQQCYLQAYQKPYLQTKGSKYVSKLCADKLKNDKYLLTNKLSECIKGTTNFVQQPNSGSSSASSEEY